MTELEPVERRDEQGGVWTVDGQAAVAERVVEFFENAEEKIVYMTVEELLTDHLIEALSDAAERDVSIKLGAVSPDVQERIQDEIPGATIFESLWIWPDTPTGRLMTIDGEKTLVSALVIRDWAVVVRRRRDRHRRTRPGCRSDSACRM